MNNNRCDKCLSEIHNGKCPCGWWYEADKAPLDVRIFEKAILTYDLLCKKHKHNDPLSCDSHNGCAMVFFRGNYQDSLKVKQYILDNIYEKKDEK